MFNRIDFTDETVLKEYISELVADKVYHQHYHDNCHHSKQMGVHLNGDNPDELLENYRPNEPKDIRDYRIQIYEPITESQGKRIINVLSKIQQNSNYSITFDEQTNIKKDETLESYTKINYPIFNSLDAWCFNVALKQGLVDANSLVVIKPLMIPDSETTFYKPFTFIYRSEQILDYGYNYYVILLDEKNVVDDVELKIWEIITDTQIFRITQLNPSNEGVVDVEVMFSYDFNGEVPAFILKGDYRSGTIPFAYDSFVSGILPYWNTAVRMNSDLDAQYVTHLYLERVEQEIECDGGCHKNTELGLNTVTKIKGGCEIQVACERCSGSGYVNGRSPYGVTSVRADAFDAASKIEFPGVTYISKPVDIIEITERKIEKLISQGFSSINMDIIDKVGDNQSGKAKDIDRTELTSFLNKISDNIFDNILRNSYHFISLWRYSVIGKVIYPTINKPTSFNALNEGVLIEEIKTLTDAGIDTTQFELDLIEKKFPNDLFKQQLNKNIIELDNLSGKNEEEKLNILMGRGCTQEQFIISSNIRSFLLDLIESQPDFIEQPREFKINKLTELAKKQIIKPIENAAKESNGTAKQEAIAN